MVLEFASFQFDPGTGELRKNGSPIRLAPQPTKVLGALLARAGELVTRDELQREVWSADTFVDFDQGLNFCLKQIRVALADSAERPQFIETVPRRGYRFIAPVTKPAAPPQSTYASPPPAAAGPAVSGRSWLRVAAAAVAAGTIIVAVAFLAWPARSDPSRTRVLLAVLPFEDLGAQPGDEYFAEGMTDELTAQLSRMNPERVGVVARTSAVHYKNSLRSAAEIGRELDVDYIVEGTVRRADGRVRIAARLVQTNDQGHVWADAFERDLRDVLLLQRSVAEAIASEVRVVLAPRMEARAPRTLDPVAYEDYLKGRYFWNRRTGEMVARGQRYFLAAVERDPTFAAAYAGLGDTYLSSAVFADSFRAALSAADRALALDDSLAEAHVTRAHALMHIYDWDGAGVAFRRAIDLDPSYAPGRYFYAEYLAARGEIDAAIEQARRAVAVDPASAIAHHVVGVVLYYATRYQDALAQFAKARELDPAHDWSRVRIAMTYLQLGDHARAAKELGSVNKDAITILDAAAGRTVEAQGALDAQTKADSPQSRTFARAVALAALGQREQAMVALTAAVDAGVYDTVYLKVDPRLGSLRPDPRFRELVRRIGLPQ